MEARQLFPPLLRIPNSVLRRSPKETRGEVAIYHSWQLSTVWDAGKRNSLFLVRLFEIIHIPRLTADFHGITMRVPREMRGVGKVRVKFLLFRQYLESQPSKTEIHWREGVRSKARLFP